MNPTVWTGRSRSPGLRRRWRRSAHCGNRPDDSSRDSPYFPLRDALFDLPPHRGKWPEIWVASQGTRMLRITGRFADAWFPYSPLVSGCYGQHLDVVRTAASDYGRDPMAITPALLAMVVTGDSRDDVDEAMDSELIKAWTLTAPGKLFMRVGADHPLGADFSGMQDLQPFAMDEESALSHVSSVPVLAVRAAHLGGTPAEVVEQAAAWRDQGVRYLVVANLSALQRSLRKGRASSVAFSKILHSLKRL